MIYYLRIHRGARRDVPRVLDNCSSPEDKIDAFFKVI